MTFTQSIQSKNEFIRKENFENLNEFLNRIEDLKQEFSQRVHHKNRETRFSNFI